MRWRAVKLWLPVFSLPRRLRLSTLLLLIALCAVSFGWLRDHQRLTAQLAAITYTPSWGVAEATGPPDVNAFGDDPLAWASKSKDGSIEWLKLTYAAGKRPVAIVVHESHCPGALMRVNAIDEWGNEDLLWEGVDPVSPSAPGGVARLPVSPDGPAIKCIKLYLDSPSVAGWNEIDAVGLEDANGNIEWAAAATASSSYGPALPHAKPLQYQPRGLGFTR